MNEHESIEFQAFEESDPTDPAGDYRIGVEFQRFLAEAQRRQVPLGATLPLRHWLDLAEAWRIRSALRDCGGNRSAAARNLGIGRRTLYSKMSKLGIEPSWQI